MNNVVSNVSALLMMIMLIIHRHINFISVIKISTDYIVDIGKLTIMSHLANCLLLA